MSEPTKSTKLTWRDGVLIVIGLIVVAGIAIYVFFVIGAILKPVSKEEAETRAIQACGNSMFSYEASCPTPEEDPELYQYP